MILPDREVYEIGVNQNVVGGPQLLVVLEEEGTDSLLHLPRFGLLLFF